MHEDWYIDPEFYAEDCTDLLNEEGADEVYRFMVHCKNCGELRPKNDPEILRTGCCYLCNKSDFHAEKRGASAGASENTRYLADLVDRLERLRGE